MVVSDRKRLVIVFRNDDLSGRSDVVHERRIASLFERYRIPQTIGVIPKCTTDSFRNPHHFHEVELGENPEIVTFLRNYVDHSGSEIALHGYTHRTNQFSQPARREFFEFRRLSLEEQCERIQRGTDIIHKALGVRPITFIPPWNRLDKNTLYACQQNGYRIVSAGPFTLTLAGLSSLGTDCGLETFPAVLSAAQNAQEQVLLRILFHSASIQTEEQISELERAVELAAQTKECEVLTLSEAIQRYSAEARRINEAARNIVSQDEVADSSRARAIVYRRVFQTVGFKPEVEKMYDRAADLYTQGQYSEACSLSSSIDQACQRQVLVGRSLAGGFGLISAICSIIFFTRVLGLNPLLGSLMALSLVGGSGMLLYWQATAPDTKREIRVAFQAALAGAVVAVGLL